MENKENTPQRKIWAFGAILLGWVLCGYLASRGAQLHAGKSAAPDICQTVFSNTCDTALKSSIAAQFGFPLAAWGLAYFGLLGLLLSLGKPATDRATVLLAAFGVGISGLLSAIMIRAHATPCPLCFGVHTVNLLALIALFWSIRPHFFSGQQPTGRGPVLRWTVMLVLIALLGGVAEYGVLKNTHGKKRAINPEEVIAAFAGETVYPIPQGDSPHRGAPAAPVQLVVFSSFQCPACQAFASSLGQLEHTFGDQLGITFKNFPLSTGCNPAIGDDMQPQACDAAIAALAAQRQNLFWQYHHGIFQSDLEAGEAALRSIAQSTGLNLEQWDADRQSEAVQASLQADVQLAHQLGINATPTVFINGRRVAAFDEAVLSALIQKELQRAATLSDAY